MLIWFLISERARKALVELQNRLYPYIPLDPPRYNGYEIENLEEIGKLMRKPPEYHTGGKK